MYLYLEIGLSRGEWGLSRFSRVRLFATPWTVARQGPLPMGFSRQEYWSEFFQQVIYVMFVAQWCPTLCNPMDYHPPGSSVHRIFQARIPEWVALSFSRGLTKVKWDHQGGPNLMLGVLIRRHQDADTQGRDHVEKWRRWPSTSKGERPQRKPHLLVFWSWGSSLQNCRTMIFCGLRGSSLLYFITAALAGILPLRICENNRIVLEFVPHSCSGTMLIISISI